MNLLVTNPRSAQAYAIIRALRPHAGKIVVTMYGAAARFSHAANSRLVDRRYLVPAPVADWHAGKLAPENTAGEEAYVQAVEKICAQERIDAIFPSFDPQVYVFSKNKVRFESMGIVIPVADYQAVVTIMDKYRLLQLASEAGFPCPRTYLPAHVDEVGRIARDTGFPVMVKPRTGTAGQGAGTAKDLPELIERFRAARARGAAPLIQEYIPGREKINFHLTLDREGEVKLAFSLVNEGNFRFRGGFGRGQFSAPPHSSLPVVVSILRKAGYWGSAHVEAKIDARDGLPKLMEINPRFGNRLWTRTALGLNEPWMCLEIARRRPVDAVTGYPLGVAFLDPVEDIMLLLPQLLDLAVYLCRTKIAGRAPADPLNPPMSLRELMRMYRRTYLGSNRKAVNPYLKFLLEDPLASLLWWAQYSTYLLRASRRLGS